MDIKDIALAILDLILPRYCAVCGRSLLRFEKHLCTYCISDIPFTYNWLMLHNPMADKFNERLGRTCGRSGKRIPYRYAAALFFFSSDALYRNIPYRIKYMGDTELGLFFGKMLGERLRKSAHLCDVDTVIPVPLHPIRKWKRGYNQAEAIATGISDTMNAALRTDILIRKKHTVTQTKLSVSEKAANVRNAFRIRKRTSCNAIHILIVDDVFTTGATLFECSKTISDAFPQAAVSIAAIALVGRS